MDENVREVNTARPRPPSDNKSKIDELRHEKYEMQHERDDLRTELST